MKNKIIPFTNENLKNRLVYRGGTLVQIVLKLKSENYKYIFFPFFVLIFSLFISCKKENTGIGNGPVVQGTISLEAHAIHHTWDVSGIMFYLKKNSTDFPGRDTSLYEYYGKGDGYGKFTFEKLYPGSYYLFATGYDAIWGDTVDGYMPVVLDPSSITDNYSKVTLIVSE